jgi:hypothetical protein
VSKGKKIQPREKYRQGQRQTQSSEPKKPHKEEIKRIYAKYDRQKEFISIAAHELKSPIVPILYPFQIRSDLLLCINFENAF